MKKFILGLGTLASTVAPIAAVVACGVDSNGLPVLTAEESTEVVGMFSGALGITLPTEADAFQIKFDKLDNGGIGLTLEKNPKYTVAPIAFTKLEKAATALSLAFGEMLKINLEFNEAKTGIKTKEFTVSGSKTATKNGVYSLKATTDQDLMKLVKDVAAKFLGKNDSLDLSAAELTKLIAQLSYKANSAEAIFGDAPGETNPSSRSGTNASFTNVKSAKLIAKTKPNGSILKGEKFDYKFELVSNASGIVVNGEKASANEFLHLTKEDEVVVIHLVGTVDTRNDVNLTTRTAMFGSKTIDLLEESCKQLVLGLKDTITYHGTV